MTAKKNKMTPYGRYTDDVMEAKWRKEEKNFGVDTDSEIARRLGVSRERVRQRRVRMGLVRSIPPINDRQPRADADVAMLVRRVPLSAKLCEQLTLARVNKGWSQVELARRMAASNVRLSAYERGAEIPTYAFFLRWCEVLGITPQIEVVVKLKG
jgi:ribosome-binding protein aMBF1 (putative translation factor)